MDTPGAAASAAAEIVMPRQTDGWVVVGCGCSDRDRETLGRTLPLLHSANLATLAIDLPTRLPVAVEQIRRRAQRLRLELGEGLPIAYLSAGLGAGAGWAASVTGELDGVMAWNPRAGHARGTLRHVSVPSLLLVEADTADLSWQVLVARALSWRLGAGADLQFAEGCPPLDAGALARWYFEELVSPPAPVLRPRSRGGATRRRLVAVAGVAAAIVGPAALPDFANAATLSRAQIGGDGAIAAHRSAAPGEHRLYGSRILGDGPIELRPFATGSKQLIDAAGVKYFINTNITFSTSSSASGAMSEASFTHSVSATTLHGGEVQSQLNGAYNGYNALCISTNNTTGTCETGNANWSIYNKNGPSTLESNGRQIDFPTQTIGALQVSRKVFVPSNDEFARWLDIITNTGATPQTFTVATGNNLGSGANTVITNDSSGNTSPTTADTWVTTFENYSGTTSSDPRLGHVLQGAGAPTPVSALQFANGNRTPWWDYSVTLQQGETKIIMNYAVVQPSKADAAAKAAQLAALSDPHQLDFMSQGEQADVANFTDMKPPAISIAKPGANAPYTRGEVVDAQYSCTALGLASCSGPVPSGSPIPTQGVGKHTFIVRASDHAGNHASLTHHYTVFAANGSGKMAASPSTVRASSAHQTLAFGYKAARGGIWHGGLTLTVPAGWSAPSTSPAAQGYVTSSEGKLSISGRTITVSIPILASEHTLTITYGSRASGGPGASAPSTTGTQIWPAQEKSLRNGLLKNLASSPQITVN